MLMRRQMISYSNNIFIGHLKLIKFCALGALVLYSLSVFISNIVYYKYQKNEVSLFPKMNFGIDIVGGNQLTISVDTAGVVSELNANSYEFLKNYCEDKKFSCDIKNDDGNFSIGVKNLEKSSGKELKEKRKQFVRELRSYLSDYSVEVAKSDSAMLVVETKITKDGLEKLISSTTDKAIAILKNRIDGVGVKEIAIQRYGTDKIVVLIPRGVKVDRIKKIINTTAKLNFHLMDKTHIFIQKPKQIMKDHKILPSYKASSGGEEIFYLVESNPVLSGDCMANVQPAIDGISNAINFRLDSNGAKKFAQITKNNIGRLLAIVLDDRVLMAPMINIPIVGGSGSITGHFSSQEVMDLSVLLRSGSLPAKISIINERSLSSVFDKNVLPTTVVATMICLFVITVLMICRYKGFGLIAFVALSLNFIFTITIISVFGFTLTLPGIAGFLLMIGMASDANILIYEKMKELKRQNIEDPATIIKNGFSKAIGVILDSNITTIIAAIALFGFGGSFIKGFSITLIFGILCSMFTAVNITRMVVNEIYGRKKKINI